MVWNLEAVSEHGSGRGLGQAGAQLQGCFHPGQGPDFVQGRAPGGDGLVLGQGRAIQGLGDVREDGRPQSVFLGHIPQKTDVGRRDHARQNGQVGLGRGLLVGQGFHQSETGFRDELNEAFADRLVIEGMGDVIAGGRNAVVERHLDVEHDRLLDGALPIINADHAFDFEGCDEDFIHARSLSECR